MKNIVLEVARSDVEEMVAQSTAYLGFKSPGQADRGEWIDRVSMVDEDRTLLERFVSESFAMAVERLKEFVVDADCSGSRLRLTLEVSVAYDGSVTVAVSESFRSYLAASALGRWLRMSYPEKGAEFDAEAIAHLSTMERNLYHRRKPVRKAARRMAAE
ncbi:MAG: hypothetical protein K2F94_01240 [Muribaculaceae bacterium]|nr:hypothetical protein [Muribaculaceae bacterium]